MKLLSIIFLITMASSCCIVGKRDCAGFDNIAYFRIRNAAGQDQVFGALKQYPLNTISAFSIKNNDSIFHPLFYQVIDNNDTVISALFNYEKHDLVYFRLGSSGNNTLINTIRSNTANCCPDYDEIVPSTFNGRPVSSENNINILIK